MTVTAATRRLPEFVRGGVEHPSQALLAVVVGGRSCMTTNLVALAGRGEAAWAAIHRGPALDDVIEYGDRIPGPYAHSFYVWEGSVWVDVAVRPPESEWLGVWRPATAADLAAFGVALPRRARRNRNRRHH